MRFITFHLDFEIEPTVEALRDAFNRSTSVTLLGFNSREEAEALASKFPKYVKTYATTMTSSSSHDAYGIYSEYMGEYGSNSYETYGLSISVSAVNEVTGAVNETGMKRIEKWIDVLYNEGYID